MASSLLQSRNPLGLLLCAQEGERDPAIRRLPASSHSCYLVGKSGSVAENTAGFAHQCLLRVVALVPLARKEHRTRPAPSVFVLSNVGSNPNVSS